MNVELTPVCFPSFRDQSFFELLCEFAPGCYILIIQLSCCFQGESQFQLRATYSVVAQSRNLVAITFNHQSHFPTVASGNVNLIVMGHIRGHTIYSLVLSHTVFKLLLRPVVVLDTGNTAVNKILATSRGRAFYFIGGLATEGFLCRACTI